MANSIESESAVKAAEVAGGTGPATGVIDYARVDEIVPPAEDVMTQVGSRKHTLSVLFYSVQPLLLSAAMVPATAYVIRTLGANSYGQWVTATTLIATTTFLTNLGLRGPFVRSVAQHPESGGSLLAEQLGIRLALSMIAAAAAVGGCFLLKYPPVVIYCTLFAAAAMMLVTVASTCCDLLQALERFAMVSWITTISGVTLTGCSVAAVVCGLGPVGVAAAYLTGPIVVVPLLLWLINRRHYRVRISLNFRRSLELVWKARYFGVQKLLSTASQNIGALTLRGFMGATQLGFFSAGSMLAERLTVIPDSLGGAAFPGVARAFKKSGRSALQVVAHFLLLAALVCVPATLCGMVLAGPIAQLLFPAKSQVCKQVIQITIWILPLMGIESVLSYSLNALHKDAAQAWASLWGAAHLLLAVLLIWQYGMLGACWAMVLRPVIRLAVIMPCVIRTFSSLWRDDPSRAAIAAANGPLRATGAEA